MARFTTIAFPIIVPGAGAANHNEDIGEDFINIVKLKIEPDLAGDTFEAEVYERDTFLDANLVYGTNPIASPNYYDPVRRDTSGTESEGTRRYVVAYEDLDASGELHLRIANNNAIQRTFTVTIVFEVPAAGASGVIPGGFTVGSVLFAAGDGSIIEDNVGLFFDPANDRLGIGTITPSSDLHVSRAHVDEIDAATIIADDAFGIRLENTADAINAGASINMRVGDVTANVVNGAISYKRTADDEGAMEFWVESVNTLSAVLELSGTTALFAGGVTTGGAVLIAGSTANDIQLKVVASNAQSANIFVVENSAGVDFLRINSAGVLQALQGVFVQSGDLRVYQALQGGNSSYLSVRTEGEAGIIQVENVGNPTTDLTSLRFGTGGGVQWMLDSSGHLEAIADDRQDIGASGANRPRSIYVGTQISVGDDPARSGAIRLRNNAAIAFRNGANSGNVTALSVDANNRVEIGSDSSRVDLGAANDDVLLIGKGRLFINDTANGRMTTGITIDQADNSNEIFTLKSSGFVTHDLTGLTEDDTFFYIVKSHNFNGGALLRGITEDDRSPGFIVSGIIGETNPGDTPSVFISGSKFDGSDDQASLAASDTLAAFGNYGTNTVARVFGDGSLALGQNAATSGILRIPNNVFLRARNRSGTGNIDILSINASNRLILGPDVRLRGDIGDIRLGSFRVNALGNSGASENVNWNDGAYQTITLTSALVNLTQTNPSLPSNNHVRMQLDILQDGVGGRDVTVPSNWVFPENEPEWTSGGSGERLILTLVYNGNNYVAVGTSWF